MTLIDEIIKTSAEFAKCDNQTDYAELSLKLSMLKHEAEHRLHAGPSQEFVDRYIENNLECPFCTNKTAEEGNDFEYSDGIGEIKIASRCTSCKNSWMNIYKLVGIEYKENEVIATKFQTSKTS